MSRTINVRLPPDLDRLIRRIARERNLTTSQVVRTLLRRTTGLVSSTFDAGFAEGLTRGEARFWAEKARQSAEIRRNARKGS